MLHLLMPRTFSLSFIAMVRKPLQRTKSTYTNDKQILLFPPPLLLPIRNLHLPSLCILPQPRQRLMVPIHIISYPSIGRRDLECRNEGTESC